MRATLFAALAALALLVPRAEASLITMQTRYYDAGPLASAEAYRDAIERLIAAPATPGYGDAAPLAFDGLANAPVMGGPGHNIAAKFTIDFVLTEAQAGEWSMQFGVDFGWGGALFVDGVAMAFNARDMWWAGSYANPAQILQTTLRLGAGRHVVELYGFENCCDGRMQARFLAPGARGWTVFGRDDGLAAPTAVPEPAGLGLFALGLLGLAALRRRG